MPSPVSFYRVDIDGGMEYRAAQHDAVSGVVIRPRANEWEVGVRVDGAFHPFPDSLYASLPSAKTEARRLATRSLVRSWALNYADACKRGDTGQAGEWYWSWRYSNETLVQAATRIAGSAEAMYHPSPDLVNVPMARLSMREARALDVMRSVGIDPAQAPAIVKDAAALFVAVVEEAS